MIHRKIRLKTLIWLILSFIIIVLLYKNFYESPNHFRRKDFITKQYAIDTKGCKIPYLEIRDEEIENLYSDIKGYKCSESPPLIESNLTSIYINLDALSSYSIPDVNNLKCHYQEFWRVKPKPGQADCQVKFGEPVSFISSINVFGENYKVECYQSLRKYIDYHYFVPKKKLKYEEINRELDDRHPNRDIGHKAQDIRGYQNGDQRSQESRYKEQDARHNDQTGSQEQLRRLSDTQNGENQNYDQLNVIISGIDSLSRIHIKRKMPKTVKYLLENMKAIEYMGYTKVGYNTFPNLIPLFTGYSFDELVQNCWPNYDTYFDNCSFVWSNFSKKGYVTSFAEEQSYFGVFNYLKKGFNDQPVDYYWDHFDRTSTDDIGHWYDLFRLYPLCMGPRPMFEVLLKSAEKFIETMKMSRFFLFLWQTTLAHNHIDTAALGDQTYLNHFKFLEKTGILNRTLLIFLSDHGYRYGKMAETHQGRLEDRLPFIYFIFPDWFKQKNRLAFSNIKRNSFKLMTTFDVFSTLNHLLQPEKLTDKYIASEKITNKRGVSLFYEISGNRTCDSGGIPAHFCTCHESLPVDKTDSIVKRITDFVIKYLNDLLSKYGDCAILMLSEIVSAELVTYGDVYHNNIKTVSDYTITFRTNPGEAFFDATVRCNLCHEDDFQLTAPVGRLNRYENQSYCIKDFNNQPYCYCKGWLEE